MEERRWTGILVGLRLGCKSKAQCHQDISDNFVLESANQCRPTDKGIFSFSNDIIQLKLAPVKTFEFWNNGTLRDS